MVPHTEKSALESSKRALGLQVRKMTIKEAALVARSVEVNENILPNMAGARQAQAERKMRAKIVDAILAMPVIE